MGQKVGFEIVKRALQIPAKTIIQNAGGEGSVVIGKLLEQENTNYGYDSSIDQFCDMMKTGIMDPLKVVRTALSDAVSVAGLLTTTEVVIVEESKKIKKGGKMLHTELDDSY